jgi:hypothetical protein
MKMYPEAGTGNQKPILVALLPILLPFPPMLSSIPPLVIVIPTSLPFGIQITPPILCLMATLAVMLNRPV